MSDHSSYSYSSYELDGICLILSTKEVLHAWVTDHWKSVDQQQRQRWRAAVRHLSPAGHWWSSWRTTESPMGERWTCQIKVDCPCPRWRGQQSTVHCGSPFAALCVCLKGLLWILKYTSDILSSSIWRHVFSKGHRVRKTDILVLALLNAKLFFFSSFHPLNW